MAKADCLGNTTAVPRFILLGFQDLPQVKSLLFLLFLTIYMLTLMGNILIVFTVSVDNQLHSPMYFFLGNLSFLEIWYPTTTVPTMLAGLLAEERLVSFAGCIAQFYFFGSFLTTECFLLTLMAYDRYVAICLPLHYSILMRHGLCVKLVVGTWVSGFTPPFFTVLFLCTLQFSGEQEVDHFFCDFSPMLKAACSDTTLVQNVAFFMSVIVLMIPFLLIIVSYVHIITAILRIPSASGRQKAFSTCSSHLAVVVMYFGTLITLYATPTTGQSMNLNKAFSLLYTVATPLLNPIIYTLRNKDIRENLRKAFRKML